MSSPWTTAKRPGGVTFLASLALLIAFASMVRGFLVLFGADVTALNPVRPSTTYAWLEIVVGVVTALVAVGLLRGSGLARLLVTALMVVRIITAIWVAITFSGQGGLLVSVLIGGIAVIVLLLLWNGRSDAFFTRT